jgi:hypothetical protein
MINSSRPRLAHLYCVGTAKSGTHSISRMFSAPVRTGHEVRASKLIERFFAWRLRAISESEMRAWVRARDQGLLLDVDSSWLNALVLRFLVEEFPDARFLLTIRDCYSWLNSELKRVLRGRQISPHRQAVRKLLYQGPKRDHAPEEKLLKEQNMYPVENYLSLWTMHNNRVLRLVPKERLLIVRTDRIAQRATRIADFAGLPQSSILLERTHEYQNPVKAAVVRQIDRNFLESNVQRHCQKLMTQFFPDIQSLDDAKL